MSTTNNPETDLIVNILNTANRYEVNIARQSKIVSLLKEAAVLMSEDALLQATVSQSPGLIDKCLNGIIQKIIAFVDTIEPGANYTTEQLFDAVSSIKLSSYDKETIDVVSDNINEALRCCVRNGTLIEKPERSSFKVEFDTPLWMKCNIENKVSTTTEVATDSDNTLEQCEQSDVPKEATPSSEPDYAEIIVRLLAIHGTASLKYLHERAVEEIPSADIKDMRIAMIQLRKERKVDKVGVGCVSMYKLLDK